MARSLPLPIVNLGGGGTVRSFRSIVLETGVAGGLLFTIHASFPNVYSWPMIWPALAGATAFWLATRKAEPHRLTTGLRAALATGVVTGLIAFVGLSVVVYVVVHNIPSLPQIGARRGLITAASIAAVAILGLIDLVVAFLGGVLVLPVRYFQSRRAHA